MSKWAKRERETMTKKIRNRKKAIKKYKSERKKRESISSFGI